MLAILLIPWMREVKRPNQIQHLAFVGSSSHYTVDITKFPKQDILKYFSKKENYVSGLHLYGVSKILLHYSVQEIANLAIDKDGR